MTTSYRRYSDQDRAVAMAFAEAEGWPDKPGALAKAARATGIKRELISRWLRGDNHAPREELVREVKLSLQEMLDAELAKIFEEMDVKREEANYYQLGIVMGIAADKKLALSGVATNTQELRLVFERTGLSSLPEHLRPALLQLQPQPIETEYEIEQETETDGEQPNE